MPLLDRAHHVTCHLQALQGKVFRKVLGKEDGIANSLKTLESNLDLDERATVILDDSPERWGPYSSLVIPIYRCLCNRPCGSLVISATLVPQCRGRDSPQSRLLPCCRRYHYFPSSSRDFKQHESRCHLLRKDDEREQGEEEDGEGI